MLVPLCEGLPMSVLEETVLTNEHHQLVSAQWLKERLNDANIVILFTCMKDPFSGQIEDLPNGFIPGSTFFDFEEIICDLSSGLPHTMPTPEYFTTEVQKLGLNKNSHVVVYDNKGIYSAPRVWWMLKTMGHEKVSVLNGGLPAWKKQGYPIDKGLSQSNKTGDFSANFQQTRLITAESLLESLGKVLLIDARSSGRFNATAPEPRAGLRAGHIPTAINLPFTDCMRDGYLRPKKELQQLISALGVDGDKKLIFSCGSGVTACGLALAFEHSGYRNMAVYDGSWSEWGGRMELPIE